MTHDWPDIHDPDIWDWTEDRIHACGTKDVHLALQCDRPGPDELAALLSPAAVEHLPEMAARATALTARRFGRTAVLYAPLYLSNVCTNGCTYCGFAHGRDIPRRTLTEEEIAEEARRVRDEGFGHVLLLTGEDRRAAPVSYIRDAILRCREVFDSVAVEVYPLDRSEYAALSEAGCDGVTLYQETYDQQVYPRLHPWGQKSDFEYRLAAPGRAAAAGMRWVSIGALLGLSDWRTEGLMLAAHGQSLRRRYWRTRLAIGFPRLRDDPGGGVELRPLAGRDLTQLVVALRLAFPDADLVLSTRESAELRDALIGVGITRLSAGSRTSPGGYALDTDAGEQFTITDHRSAAEVATALAERGIEPVWKDWDPSFLG